MKKLVPVLVGLGVAMSAAPAFAGEWRLDARACADIREDWRDARENRRDARYDYGYRDRVEDRYDRREDRRDRRMTICPRSAFYYVDDRRGGRGDRWSNYDRRDDWRRDDWRRDERRPRLELRYDHRLRMHYRYDHGRKIYVRG
ncbi:MAG: hypothetical protein HXY21_11350 [Parvularculaceae bacterium]|nr:hypothetical protein [Parvularculaceae bacterium]